MNLYQSNKFTKITINGIDDDDKKIIKSFFSYLKRRGFTLTEDSYGETIPKYGIYHKLGQKGDLLFHLSAYSSSIDLEFYQEINTEHKSGGRYDFNKYELMPYKIKLMCQNESNRAIAFLTKKLQTGVKYSKDTSNWTPLQHVLDRLNSGFDKSHYTNMNEAIQGQLKIKDKYTNTYHKDMNGKVIQPGERKYFYDSSTKRLSNGVVLRNTNQMWWVICENSYHNLASKQLFDFSPNLPRRRVLTNQEKFDKLKRAMDMNVREENFERCIAIREYMRRFTSEKKYHVWSIANGSWWRDGNAGYTNFKERAGVYLESTINEHQSYYNDGQTNEVVEIK